MADVAELIKMGDMAVIKIVNPPQNILSSEVLFKLQECIENVKNDTSIKVVVLTGKGLFSVGASVPEIYEIAKAKDASRAQELLTKANDIVNAIQNLGKPTIAAIKRFCLGGGNEIAMACAYRIAVEGTVFGQPEIKLGIIPGMGGTQRLPRLVGIEKALPWLLTGAMISAEEAKKSGLVDEVVPDGQLTKFVAEFAKQELNIISKDLSIEVSTEINAQFYESESIRGVVENNKYPDACEAIIKAVAKGWKMKLEDGLNFEQKLFSELVVTDKAQGGLEAFLGIKKEALKSTEETDDSSRTNGVDMEILQMTRESIQEFTARNLKDAVIEEMETKKEVSPEILQEIAQSGFFGIPFDEKYGGAGLGKTGYCVFLEEISRKWGSLATVAGAHMGLFLSPIELFGTEKQKEKYLKTGIEGAILGAFALTEPNAGSDAFSLSTSAEKKGDEWLLNGSKQFITNGSIADFILVFTQTNKNLGNAGITAFIVERKWKGVSIGEPEKKMGLHASKTVNVTLEDVKVPQENLLGTVGQGYKIAMITLNGGRLSLAAGCLGAAKEAFEIAYTYAEQREQFGKSLLDQQIIQQYFAEMRAKIYLMENTVYNAARRMDAGEDIRLDAAILKLTCSEMSDWVIDKAVQILGGYGYITEYKVERLYRDSRINQIFEGTNEIQKLDIFKNIFKDGGKIKPII